MKILKLISVLLLLVIVTPYVAAQTQTVSVKTSVDSVTIMSVEKAEQEWNRLWALSQKSGLSSEQQGFFSSLTIALGTLPSIHFDCSGLSVSERSRVQMGSRLAASKCVKVGYEYIVN